MIWIVVFYVKGAAQDWEESQRCFPAKPDILARIKSWSVCIVVPTTANSVKIMVEPATILLIRALLNQVTMQDFEFACIY